MDLTDYLQFIAALVFVIALIGGFAIVARRLGLSTRFATVRNAGRIGVVASVPLDARRRLVLLRRDDREHLVILSQAGETVVEAGITPPPEQAAPDDQPGVTP